MRVIIGLFALILACVLVLMPPQVKILGKTLYRPRINLNLGSTQIVRDLNFRLGLDLQGGSHLVYQADTSKVPAGSEAQAISSVRENIERRINLLGVAEPLIQTSQSGNQYRLIVELPGVKDINEALKTIGATASLDFREVETATPSATTATPSAQVIFKPTDLTGKDLQTAQVQFGSGTNNLSGAPVVSIQFNPDGAAKFAELTKKNLGKPIAIFLDNQLITAPVVQNEIVGGQAVISGDFTIDDAKRLSIQLNAGALPVPITLVEQRTIGATLGSESVAKSLVAGIIGLVVIWIFMIGNYGLKGVVASIALSIYIVVSLSIFKLVPVTLTLAGIAGFVLSVGMAVDANILIFERMKEELRWGRPRNVALELGFHRAWTSVRDSNVSSCITAAILFWFGTGSVRGFALTLLIGIAVSLLSSITITRSLLRLIYAKH